MFDLLFRELSLALMPEALVSADGLFEWKTAGKKKLPYFVRPSGGGLFVDAGVWDRWDGPEGAVDTVAVLTVAVNELIKRL